ncbi:MAG: hypothetical protein IKS47_05050 [Bacteroidales bacterium]|nr:hypothetical protein [Bacteroidales bacterium]
MKGKNCLILTVMLLLLAVSCKEQEVLVNRVTIEPDHFDLLVNDFKKITISTYPHFAANEDMLDYYLTNKEVAFFDGQTIVGKKEGNTELIAECDGIIATCKVRVLKWRMNLEGKEYGITEATGKVYKQSATGKPQLEIHLTHEYEGTEHHIDIWIADELLNQTVDFTQHILETANIAAYYGFHENGYAICSYYGGDPLIYTSAWEDTSGISLTKGTLSVTHPQGSNQYIIKADFELSNGFTFNTHWEGPLPIVLAD